MSVDAARRERIARLDVIGISAIEGSDSRLSDNTLLEQLI